MTTEIKDTNGENRFGKTTNLHFAVKRKRKKRKLLRPCKRTKNTMKNGGDTDTNCICCARNNSKRIGKGTERLGNKRTSGNHPDYSIVKIDQNTEMGPGDLRRLAVTQIPVENYQLTLAQRTLK